MGGGGITRILCWDYTTVSKSNLHSHILNANLETHPASKHYHILHLDNHRILSRIKFNFTTQISFFKGTLENWF